MTLKEMIHTLCGSERNMSQFAEEISKDFPISAASLYRLSSGGQHITSRDLLRAIIKHASPDCEITLEDLEAACKAQSISVRPHSRKKKVIWMERVVTGIILETAIASGATVSKDAPLTASRHNDGQQHFYNAGLILSRDGVTQTAYFEVKSSLPSGEQMSLVDMEIGRILREDPSPDKFYYLIFLTEKDQPNPDVSLLLTQLSGTKIPINLNIVAMALSENGSYSSAQVTLGSEEGILSFEQ